MTDLQKAINGHQFITARQDKAIHIHKEKKTNFVNLVISDGVVYAASLGEEATVIGTVVITNIKILEGRNPRPTDQIKVIQVLPTAIIGEITGP